MSELYELLTFEAFGQRYPELTSRHQILPGRGVFCKAERLQSGVIGTYAMPQRMAPTGEKHFFGYYLTEKKLLLVEKGKPVEKRHCPKAEVGHCVNCRPTCAITTGFSGAGAFCWPG